ncbi:THYROID RECEPTOR INTERACTING PROTEIN RELATED [Salix purpurea]|uniref:THYROID RECEPTOR INTERACTING PROTEIN RELATED n=1 Tax=Salix purpurea TaxID=77065 RepID=A0A9Q0ZW63_SALPP|nr:THYROID RECEPTOR INTERACTING PROTEIN RELATED [Salix purpurea]
MESAGGWLEKTLVDLGLDLDRDIISGLVSYCELAQPLDAKEYLLNIIGQEASKGVIEEYLQRRGQSDLIGSTPAVQSSRLQTYIKPLTEKHVISGGKKQVRTSKDTGPSDQGQAEPKTSTVSSYIGNAGPSEASESRQKGIQGKSRKKKAGKVVSLAKAAKGSFVFQQGKPCPCQARQHRLVSNCLSCGKIVCEQEGEGPCSFCGALVLKEGSTYAGLEESMPPISDAEFAAEAYAKRLVDYDRNSAARTTVIDDQSDYYEIEGNSWLSNEVFKFLQYATYWLHLPTSNYKQLSSLLYRLSFYLFFLSLQEKQLLRKKQEETEEAEQAKRNKVVVTFDLVGRKVILNRDEVEELESENRLLRPLDEGDRELNRIKPNPSLRIQPVFVDPGPIRKPAKGKQSNKGSLSKGLCLEITGRVQHDSNELKHFMIDNRLETSSIGNLGKVQN